MATASSYTSSRAVALHPLSFDGNSVWFHESNSACLTSVTISYNGLGCDSDVRYLSYVLLEV
jgi:hypothetical protein